MSDLVCLKCGSEIPYDWAPCPECGWKAPSEWEESSEEPEEGSPASRHAVLSSPKKWIKRTAWFLITIGLILLLYHLFG